METERYVPSAKSILWGVFIMLLGTVFLLDRLHVLHLPRFETLWPIIFFVFAAGRFIDGRVGAGVANLLIGTWLLGCTTHWNGMTLERSWPMALIAVGTGIVIRALTGEDRRRWRRKEE